MELSKRIIYFGKYFFIFIPVMFLLWMVSKYSVNGLFWDDLEPITDYLNMKESGHIDWSVILALHNEHRIVIPRIIIMLVGAVTHWNTKVVVYISALLLAIAYYVFVRNTIDKKIADFRYYDVLYALVVGFCMFSCCQYENLLWSFQVAWFLIEFCVILGLTSLSLYVKTGADKYIIYAALFGVISSFSSLHGLAIWPCYIAVAALYQIFERRFDKKIWCYITVVMAVVLVLYFCNYHAVAIHSGARALSILQALNFALRNVGSVLAMVNLSFPQLIFGISEVALLLVLFVLLLKNKQIKQNILPLGLIIFGSGVAMMLGFGRSGWDAMASRYMTFPLLIVMGNLAILKRFCTLRKISGCVFLACFFFFSGSCLNTSFDNFDDVQYWYKDKSFRTKVLENYEVADMYKLVVLIYPHFRTREDVVERIGKIEKARLSIFYKGGKN